MIANLIVAVSLSAAPASNPVPVSLPLYVPGQVSQMASEQVLNAFVEPVMEPLQEADCGEPAFCKSVFTQIPSWFPTCPDGVNAECMQQALNDAMIEIYNAEISLVSKCQQAQQDYAGEYLTCHSQNEGDQEAIDACTNQVNCVYQAKEDLFIQEFYQAKQTVIARYKRRCQSQCCL